MADDLWGYIHIESADFPSALIQKGPFKDTGWASYSNGHRGFWLNCGDEPSTEERVALESAQQSGQIEDFSIRPYTAEDLARRWS